MSMSEKFLFDTSFEQDELEASAASGRSRAAARYSQEDLDKAREDAFAGGKKTGEQEAKQAIEQHVAQTLAAITDQLSALARTQAAFAERHAGEAIEVAVTIVRKLFSKLAEDQGLVETDSLVRDCLERLREEPRIVIRVADSLLDPVEQRVGSLASQCGFEGKIVFLSQEGLQPGDVRVEWADGGAERDSERLWREIDEVVGRAVGLPRPPTAAAEPSPASEPKSESAAQPAAPGPAAENVVVSA